MLKIASKNRTQELTYTELRAALLNRGHTLRSFALAHGYSIPTIYCAAKRTRRGRKSVPIINHLLQFVS